jgi:hypothetical protein
MPFPASGNTVSLLDERNLRKGNICFRMGQQMPPLICCLHNCLDSGMRVVDFNGIQQTFDTLYF